MALKFELIRDFCTTNQPTKFHHPAFNRSKVIVLTNKEIRSKTSTARAGRCATPAEKSHIVSHERCMMCPWQCACPPGRPAGRPVWATTAYSKDDDDDGGGGGGGLQLSLSLSHTQTR